MSRLGRLPDPLLKKLFGSGFGPAAVRRGTGGAGVEDFSQLGMGADARALDAAIGVVPDADDELGLQRLERGLERAVADSLQRVALFRLEFVWSDVAARFLEKNERAVIGDPMIGEEGGGVAVARLEKAPESAAADFGSRAIVAENGTFWVLFFRGVDGGVDADPLSDGFDFAEGRSGLHHPERAGIHAQEDDSLRCGAVAFDVLGVGGPGVVEGLVDKGDGRGEGELIGLLAQRFGDIDQWVGRLGPGHQAGYRRHYLGQLQP